MSRHRNKSKSYKPMSLVDIIIPVYNRSDLLKRCLEYIPQACGDISHSIFIFDNGSNVAKGPQDVPDAQNIRSLCEQFGANYIRSSKNIGFPGACNQAARKGSAPLIFFLNDDVFLLPESIQKIVRALDDPTIGVVGMKLLFPLDSQDQNRPAGKIQHVGLSTNIRGEFFHHFVGWSPQNPRTHRIKYPYAVTGAALMTRRKLFMQAGGFNEEYGMGTYEDVDYCLTIREMGYNIYIEHEAIGYHLTGATAVSQQIPYPIQHNADLFRLRWKGKIAYTEWENW